MGSPDGDQGESVPSSAPLPVKKSSQQRPEPQWSSSSGSSPTKGSIALSSASSGSSGSSSGSRGHAQNGTGSAEALAAAQAAYEQAVVQLTQQLRMNMGNPHQSQYQEPMFVQTDVAAYLEQVSHMEQLQQASARMQQLVAAAEHSSQVQADVHSLHSQLSQLNRLKAAADIIDAQRSQRPMQPMLRSVNTQRCQEENLEHLVQNISSLSTELQRFEMNLKMRQVNDADGAAASLNDASQALIQQAVSLLQGRVAPSMVPSHSDAFCPSSSVPNVLSVPQIDRLSMGGSSLRF